MATSNLYLYKTVYELTVLNNGQRLEGPMYNNTIKIHKGIDDKIAFNVYDENRRLASISHLTLSLNIIDANTGVLVLTKVPVIRDDVKGTLDVTFSWGETANLDAGLYEFSITTTDTADESSALYTDLAQSAIGTIEILDNILPSPSETLSVSSFTVNGTRHESNALSASPNRSYQSSNHTCAVYTTTYTGKLYVEGSHDLTAPTNWFGIDLHPDNTLMDWNAYTATSGIDPFNFTISTNWVRFVHVPTVGALATMDTFSAADVSRTAGTYTGVVGSGTTGTFDIVVDGTGAVTSVTIVTSGSGHVVDDTITIANANLGNGTNGEIVTIDTFSAADALRTAGTYNGVTGTSDGSGAVGTFNIVVAAGGAVTSVTVVTGGNGHAVDDTITITDAVLGGGGAAVFTMDVATLLYAVDFTMDVATITGTLDKVLIRS